MRYSAQIFLCGLTAISSLSFADDSFESIGGFRLGQECTSSKFTKKQSEVHNPNDVLDVIEVSRMRHESTTTGGHLLNVQCGVIDNKVISVSLTSSDPNSISTIKTSLHEKLGRSPDDKNNINSKPQRILGLTMDGYKMESEYWNLSDNRRATAYTKIIQPYGSTSLSDLKWQGGIGLSYSNSNDAEWRYLKDRGMTSSKQKKALDEKQKKDSVKSLLD